jgi:hypothetical protein
MSIEKSLYQAPVGLDALTEDPIEIEIIDAELDIEEDVAEDEDFDQNLAEVLPEKD